MSDLFQMEKLATDSDRYNRERVFWAIIATVGRPKSYLDIGCGDGWLVRAARQIGCKPALGVGSRDDKVNASKWASIVAFDIARPFRLDCNRACMFELVTNFKQAHPSNLWRHVTSGGYIVTNVEYDEQFPFPVALNDMLTERIINALGSRSYRVYKCE